MKKPKVKKQRTPYNENMEPPILAERKSWFSNLKDLAKTHERRPI